MTVIIPTNITANYLYTGKNNAALQVLEVGKSIKDLDANAATTMKSKHEAEIVGAKDKFKAIEIDYNARLATANAKAGDAANNLKTHNVKRIVAITFLALCIIAAVALFIAAFMTFMAPLVFVALPIIGGAMVAGYFAHSESNNMDKCKSIMSAPGKMRKPELVLPKYDAGADLELLDTRVEKQNAIAMQKLEEIAASNCSPVDIVNFALLDKVVAIKPENRPQFYATCAKLIVFSQMNLKEKRRVIEKTASEVEKYVAQLDQWAQTEKRRLEVYRSETYRGQAIAANALMNLGMQRGKGLESIKNWEAQTLTAINDGYAKACKELGTEYYAAQVTAEGKA